MEIPVNSDDKLFAMLFVGILVFSLLYRALRVYAQAHGINVN